MSAINKRLEELGIEIPDPPPPGGSYVPVVITGSLAFVAGQIPFWNGEIPYKGKIGVDVDEEFGRKAAETCALNILAALRQALNGDLDRTRRCVKLGVFVNCVDGFDKHPEIANGASDLIVKIFGERGRHARFAVGAHTLPRNVTVEVDAVFEIE